MTYIYRLHARNEAAMLCCNMFDHVVLAFSTFLMPNEADDAQNHAGIMGLTLRSYDRRPQTTESCARRRTQLRA